MYTSECMVFVPGYVCKYSLNNIPELNCCPIADPPMETSGFDNSYVCSCGRSFPGPGPLNFHKRTCQSSKKRLHGALVKVKELWKDRKRPRLDLPDEPVLSQSSEIRADEGAQSLDIVRDLSLFFVPTSDFQSFNFQSEGYDLVQPLVRALNAVGFPDVFVLWDAILTGRNAGSSGNCR